MNSGPHKATQIAWAAALAVFAAGVALLTVSSRDLNGARIRIERRMQELRALREIESRLIRYESALRDVEARQPGPPPALQAIVTNAIPSAAIDFRPLAATNTIPAWSLRAMEVSGKALQLEEAMHAIRELDSVWPRWVLVDLQVRASAEPGSGRVTMRFESIARQDGSDSAPPRP